MAQVTVALGQIMADGSCDVPSDFRQVREDSVGLGVCLHI